MLEPLRPYTPVTLFVLPILIEAHAHVLMGFEVGTVPILETGLKLEGGDGLFPGRIIFSHISSSCGNRAV